MRTHSVSYFLIPVLKNHSSDFEIYTYHTHDKEDETTETIKALSTHHRNLSKLDNQAAADAIRKDEIDILFDLHGHTHSEKMGIFAHRAAPTQIAWVGYPNTTGMKSVDYRITDQYADPKGEMDHLYTEKLIHMPECFSVYTPPESYPDVSSTPALKKWTYYFWIIQ